MSVKCVINQQYSCFLEIWYGEKATEKVDADNESIHAFARSFTMFQKWLAKQFPPGVDRIDGSYRILNKLNDYMTQVMKRFLEISPTNRIKRVEFCSPGYIMISLYICNNPYYRTWIVDWCFHKL